MKTDTELLTEEFQETLTGYLQRAGKGHFATAITNSEEKPEHFAAGIMRGDMQWATISGSKAELLKLAECIQRTFDNPDNIGEAE